MCFVCLTNEHFTASSSELLSVDQDANYDPEACSRWAGQEFSQLTETTPYNIVKTVRPKVWQVL